MSISGRRLRLSVGPGIYFCIRICSGERFMRVLWDTLNHDKISWQNLTFTGHGIRYAPVNQGSVLHWSQRSSFLILNFLSSLLVTKILWRILQPNSLNLLSFVEFSINCTEWLFPTSGKVRKEARPAFNSSRPCSFTFLKWFVVVLTSQFSQGELYIVGKVKNRLFLK